MIDTSKSFLQQQKITKSGRINEVAFTFAYSFDDIVYLGGSLAMPILKFNYNSDYAEIDDKNEMRRDDSLSSTYSYYVHYYKDFGGIKDFHYQSTFTTTATGLNLKLGTIIRPTDYLRIGVYYHTPTVYYAKDLYYYTFTTNWDKGSSLSFVVPDGGGVYNYIITTPSKTGFAISGVLSNMMSVNAEYEIVDYSKGKLSSKDVGVFDAANKAIKEKYKMSGNLRFGFELNTKPVMFRAGWASYGSPFGNQILGNYVRNSISIGCGFKTNYFYFDFALIKTFSGKQEYYMYNPKYCDLTNIKLNLTQFVFTIGLIGKRFDEIDHSRYGSLPPPYPNDNNTPPQENKPKIPY
jgi:hypothetical protein